MRITAVAIDRRRRAFMVRLGRADLAFPFAACDPAPSGDDSIDSVCVDPELGRRGFTYRLASGHEGTVLSEQVLEYNRDPRLLRERTLHLMTARALEAMEQTPLAKREIIRQLGTSPSQLYRLLDPTNYRKTVDQMLRLFAVLGCDVEFTVRTRTG